MEPGLKVIQSHQRLSRCSADFLDFAERNPESKERSSFEPLVRFNDVYLQTQPWPTFINGETRKEAEDTAIKIYELIASIPDRLFSRNPEKISEYYGIPVEVVELMFHGITDDHVYNILGRGDFVFDADYVLKCLEYNLSANLGGWEVDILESLYVNTPVISKFLQEYNVKLQRNQFFQVLLEFIIDRALGQFQVKNGGEVNLCLVFNKFIGGELNFYTNYLQKKYTSVMQSKYSHLNLKGNVSVCLLSQLKIIDESLYVHGKRVHVLLDLTGNKVPILLMELVRKGNLTLYNGPVSRLQGNKLNLALLSEFQDSDLFTAEERETIQKHIPWTRKVVPGETTFKGDKVQMEDLLLDNREGLVLKAAVGSGGTAVIPGKCYSHLEWEIHVKKALSLMDTMYAVQEYIESPPLMYQRGKDECIPHYAAWGFFVFGSRYAGGFVRLLPVRDNKIVINSKQGAEESMILEVEE